MVLLLRCNPTPRDEALIFPAPFAKKPLLLRT